MIYPEEVNIKDSISSVILHLTNACNLNCTYCFESNFKDGDMEKDVLRSIILRSIDSVYFQSLLKPKKKNSEKPRLSISFFGGEPMLRFDLIKYGVEIAKANTPENINVAFGVTTNGTLFSEEKIDFMAENNFSMILSIDGDKKTHDMFRIVKPGVGSYDMVVKHLPYLLKKMGRRVTARPTFVPETGIVLFNTTKHIAGLGISSIAPIPVIDSGGKGERLGWDSKWKEIEDQYWKIAKWWVEEFVAKNRYIDIKFIRDFFRDFISKDHKTYGLACGTGIKYQAYAPNGDIYSCHRNVNDPRRDEMYVGKYNEENIPKERYDKLAIKREDFTSELDCKHCPFEDICSKGCNVANLHTTGDRTKLPKEQCWFLYLQYKIGMRILSRYGHMRNLWEYKPIASIGKINNIAKTYKREVKSNGNNTKQGKPNVKYRAVNIVTPRKDK